MFADTNIMRFPLHGRIHVDVGYYYKLGEKTKKNTYTKLVDWRIRDLRCLVYIARAMKLHHFRMKKTTTAKSSAPECHGVLDDSDSFRRYLIEDHTFLFN